MPEKSTVLPAGQAAAPLHPLASSVPLTTFETGALFCFLSVLWWALPAPSPLYLPTGWSSCPWGSGTLCPPQGCSKRMLSVAHICILILSHLVDPLASKASARPGLPSVITTPVLLVTLFRRPWGHLWFLGPPPLSSSPICPLFLHLQSCHFSLRPHHCSTNE